MKTYVRGCSELQRGHLLAIYLVAYKSGGLPTVLPPQVATLPPRSLAARLTFCHLVCKGGLVSSEELPALEMGHGKGHPIAAASLAGIFVKLTHNLKAEAHKLWGANWS